MRRGRDQPHDRQDVRTRSSSLLSVEAACDSGDPTHWSIAATWRLIHTLWFSVGGGLDALRVLAVDRSALQRRLVVASVLCLAGIWLLVGMGTRYYPTQRMIVPGILASLPVAIGLVRHAAGGRATGGYRAEGC